MNSDITDIKSISQLHKIMGVAEPGHPLISMIDLSEYRFPEEMYHVKFTTNLYCIMLKDADCGLKYGRNRYDFEEGVLIFFAPRQVVSSSVEVQSTKGWMLFFHPDLIRKAPLGKQIEQYTFFSYEVHEALHLAAKEENILNDIAAIIKSEYNENIDGHTQTLLVSNLDLLLSYCNRFYERQFHTRTNHHKDVVTRFEQALSTYYEQQHQLQKGVPTVRYLAEKVNLSANYLSDLLKKETGRNTKEHINDFVVSRARNELLATTHSVSAIAYDLGFNYPHYFSRLFKLKTGLTPQQYRKQVE